MLLNGFSGICGVRLMLVCNLTELGKDLLAMLIQIFFADLERRRSLTGYVFIIGGCAVSWRACLQLTVVQSITEAEYIAVCDACKEAIWLKGLYAELSGDSSCIDLFCDSQSVISHKRSNLS
jgi:hypothetical protein